MMFRSRLFKKNDVWLKLTFSVPIVDVYQPQGSIRQTQITSSTGQTPTIIYNSSTKKNVKKSRGKIPRDRVLRWTEVSNGKWKTCSTGAERLALETLQLTGHCSSSLSLVVVADDKSSTGQWSQETGDKRARHGSGGQQESFRSNLVKCYQPS